LRDVYTSKIGLRSDSSLVTLDEELQPFCSSSSDMVLCAAALNSQSIYGANTEPKMHSSLQLFTDNFGFGP